jgi:hypothetical protein
LPGLTRQSIFFAKISFAKRMDARVKLAHDNRGKALKLAAMGTNLRIGILPFLL